VGVFGEKAAIDMTMVQEKELRLIGIARYIIEDFQTAIDLVTGGRVKLSPLISHEFDFYDFAEAYRHIDEKRDQTMKVMILVN